MTNFRLYAAALSVAVFLTGAPSTLFSASTPAAKMGKPEKPDKGDKGNKPTKVTWSPSRITEEMIEAGEAEGDPGLISATFTTDKPIFEYSFRLSGSLRNYLAVVECEDAEEIPEEGITEGEVCFELSQMPEEAGKTIGGTVQMVTGGKSIAKPLPFSLKRESDDEETDDGEAECEADCEPTVDESGDLPISWDQDQLTSDLFEDGMATLELTANRGLENVKLWATPSLGKCVDVEFLTVEGEDGGEVPAECGDGSEEADPDAKPIVWYGDGSVDLPAGSCIVVKFTLNEGAELCDGTVHVRGAGSPPRTYPTVLSVGDDDEQEGEDGGESDDVNPVAIVNGASFEETPVAPGQIVSIFGEDLGPQELEVFELNEDGEVDEMLGDVMVFFDGYPGRVLSANSDQINVIVPTSVKGGSTDLLVINGKGRSTLFPLALTPVAPSLFTLTGTGRGQGAILNSDGSINGNANAARFGTTITFFGTGMGPTEPPLPEGVVAQEALPLAADVEVFVGGVEAMVTYAGSAPGMVSAVSQINARMSAATPKGPQDIVVVVDGVASPTGIKVVVR